eukprot:2532591-Alexandrium_andersonii.AAC.1
MQGGPAVWRLAGTASQRQLCTWQYASLRNAFAWPSTTTRRRSSNAKRPLWFLTMSRISSLRKSVMSP